MKNKIIKAFMLLSVITLFVIITAFTGCSQTNGGNETTAQKTETTTESASQTSKAPEESKAVSSADNAEKIYTENGVDVLSAAVEIVGETPNLQVVFANTNAKSVDFDCSKFEIRAFDTSSKEAVYKVNATTKTLEANKTYIQYAFTVDDGGKLKEGDSVFIYYGSNAIDAVEVTKF